MNDIRARLTTCFATVFPALEPAKIPSATQKTVAAWDSVAAITLLNVIEEEFNTQVDFEALADLDSFDAIAAYLNDRVAAENQGA
ncbi:MAG TPA: acyl carrier protein [Bryobacteraceae bacterium]|jgi:acyl carrier protein|nr:acyl carrier protein [Bryobacteraceae bacterium]